MGELARQIADAKAEVARLERLAASATCAELGHDWHSLGGMNCGCFDGCGCSVPVHECRRCGDCDYGENKWAKDQRENCHHPAEHEAYMAAEAAADQRTTSPSSKEATP